MLVLVGMQVKDRLKAMMHAGQSFTGRAEPEANGGTDVDEGADLEAGVRHVHPPYSGRSVEDFGTALQNAQVS